MNHDPADQLWSQIENDGTQEAPESMNAAQTESADNDVITNLERERDEFKDMYMRSVAEAQNIQRRAQVDVENSRKFATENLVVDILPVLDNFERAVQSPAEGDAKTFLDGFVMIHQNLMATLQKHGLAPIEAVGQPFDPNLHQAIMRVETDEYPEDTVVEVLQTGYTVDGRCIRPAMVKVSGN